MNTTQMLYLPPRGEVPVIGMRIRCFDGLRQVIEIVEAQADGQYRLRLEKIEHEDDDEDDSHSCAR